MPKTKQTNKYAQLSTERFDEILLELCNDEGAGTLLTIPGVYEIVAEHYNNDVLDRWKDEQDETDTD